MAMDGANASREAGRSPGHYDYMSEPVQPPAPVRVFLVEDSPMIRERLIEGISSEGKVEVIGYSDTEAGAEKSLARLDCDVVVLDLDLKQGNGLRVLEWLRAGSTLARPVVIIFTNYVLQHYRTRSMQLGADYFFDKARDFDRVLEVIEKVASPPGASLR
jgi:DNA-binding NarL/FixJ family response regulator